MPDRLVGDDQIQRLIEGLCRDFGQFLRREGQPDRADRARGAQQLQAAVVIAAAIADSVAGLVEGGQKIAALLSRRKSKDTDNRATQSTPAE